MIKDYVSIYYATSNEDGMEEIRLEKKHPFWYTIWASLRSQSIEKTKVDAFVRKSGLWVEKKTGKVVDSEMQVELANCKNFVEMPME